MREKRGHLTVLVITIFYLPLSGSAGGTKDGLLSFLVLFSFLGLVLGIKLMIDYIKFLAGRFNDFRRYLEEDDVDN